VRIRPAAAGAALLVLAGAAWWGLRGAAPRPHVVVLLWDTTRADRLSCQGHTRETSPWLDGLAARGVRFEECRAPSPWTLPSHASLFTGLLPRDHGATAVDSVLADAHRTLAEDLADAGYDTLLVTNNDFVSPRGGLAQGFDRVIENGRARGGDATAARTRDLLAAELASRDADPSRRERPLFLFVNLMEPHAPYAPTDAAERAWRPAGATEARVAALRAFGFPGDMRHNLGLEVLPREDLDILGALYDAEIRDLDGHCRELEALLAARGILAPPAAGGRGFLLAVTSDHGENLGEHGLLEHKNSVHETLLRVPLVLWGPGRFEGGGVRREAVRLQDLHATVREAAGLPRLATTPDASPLPRGDAPADPRPQRAEFPAPVASIPRLRALLPGAPEEAFAPMRRGYLAVIEGGLKWVRTEEAAGPGRAATVTEALYDLRTDPGEERDLLAGPSPDPAHLSAARRLAAR
jgi:arylsulfatase A-like enzyme